DKWQVYTNLYFCWTDNNRNYAQYSYRSACLEEDTTPMDDYWNNSKHNIYGRIHAYLFELGAENERPTHAKNPTVQDSTHQTYRSLQSYRGRSWSRSNPRKLG